MALSDPQARRRNIPISAADDAADLSAAEKTVAPDSAGNVRPRSMRQARFLEALNGAGSLELTLNMGQWEDTVRDVANTMVHEIQRIAAALEKLAGIDSPPPAEPAADPVVDPYPAAKPDKKGTT